MPGRSVVERQAIVWELKSFSVAHRHFDVLAAALASPGIDFVHAVNVFDFHRSRFEAASRAVGHRARPLYIEGHPARRVNARASPHLDLDRSPQDFSDRGPSELSAVQHSTMSEINISAERRYQYGENAGAACALRHAQQSVHGVGRFQQVPDTVT
jgi:hypothetical protein